MRSTSRSVHDRADMGKRRQRAQRTRGEVEAVDLHAPEVGPHAGRRADRLEQGRLPRARGPVDHQRAVAVGHEHRRLLQLLLGHVHQGEEDARIALVGQVAQIHER